jgi:hypothetical protein
MIVRPVNRIRLPAIAVGSDLTEFFTTFSETADENPLSQGGLWINGETDGLDWRDFQISGGNACAADFSTTGPPPYNDAIAILKPSAFACNSDQFAEIVVHRGAGYNPGSGTHEHGLFLRFTLEANLAQGYEVYLNWSGNFAIVRWNGLVNDWDTLSAIGPGPADPQDGDVFRFEAEGTELRVYQNGGLIKTANDATFTSGQPGLQSYVSGSNKVLANYGSQSFRCGNL